jgi:hypothetical protein
MKPEPTRKSTTQARIEKALATTVAPEMPAIIDEDMSWADEVINTEDIVLPRILLMQALSPLVAEKELAEPGDIVKSTTEEVIAPKGEALRIVPISSFKTWRKEKKVDGKWKFYSQEPHTPETANRGWEEFEEMDPRTNKKEIFKWVRCFNFYVNLKSDLEAAVKGESAALPCLISFKSTSFDTGKKIYSGIAEGMTMKSVKNPKGLPAFSREYSLSSKKTVGDKGTFYTFEVIQGKLIPDQERAIASKWYSTVKQSSVKVHEANDDT